MLISQYLLKKNILTDISVSISEGWEGRGISVTPEPDVSQWPDLALTFLTSLVFVTSHLSFLLTFQFSEAGFLYRA